MSHLYKTIETLCVNGLPCTLQLRCGCSYAFSALAALEGVTALATSKLQKLSEQNIVDCSSIYIRTSYEASVFVLLTLIIPNL